MRKNPIISILSQGKEVQLKFVVKDEAEVIQVSEWLKSIQTVAPIPIVIIQPERYSFEESPEGSSRIIYLDRMKDLIEWCEKYLSEFNYRVLPQLHYLIYRGEKGR